MLQTNKGYFYVPKYGPSDALPVPDIFFFFLRKKKKLKEKILSIIVCDKKGYIHFCLKTSSSSQKWSSFKNWLFTVFSENIAFPEK